MNTNYTFATNIIKGKFNKTTSSKVKKYTFLYHIIKESILDSSLPNNWNLPSTRLLSSELNISRTTVIKAYELLQLEQLIISKIGSGYKVSYNLQKNQKDDFMPYINQENYPTLSERGLLFKKNFDLLNRNNKEYIAFRPGLPPLDIFPVNQWKNLLNNYWRYIKSSNLSYAQATGDGALKESIKNYLYISRGIRCKAEQVVVLSGSLQSLYIINNALLNQGDHVVLENPSFPNVHSIFKSLNATLHPISLDTNGIDIHYLNNLKLKHPKLIHVTPTNHYPLGIKMSLDRRRELLEYASQQKSIIVENDYEHEVANFKEKLPTIYSLDQENRTVYMGTFNRLLHPSIRLGFMIVPVYLIEVVKAIQEHSHRFVAPSMQMVMNQFIDKNYLYQHLKNIIRTAEKRHKIFINTFSKIKSMEIYNTQFCSLHTVAIIKNNIEPIYENEIIHKLYNHNITAFPLSKCYINKSSLKGLIFGYSAVNDRILNKKLNILKNIIP